MSNIFEFCLFIRQKRMVQKLIILGPKKSPAIFYFMYVQNAILKIKTKKISNYIPRKITPDPKKFLKPKSKLNQMMTTKILKKSSNQSLSRRKQQRDSTIPILTQKTHQMYLQPKNSKKSETDLHL